MGVKVTNEKYVPGDGAGVGLWRSVWHCEMDWVGIGTWVTVGAGVD